MVLKIINATEAKVGTNILIDKEPYTVRKIDISKTGKHGHSKARIEAVGVLDTNKKKILVLPGHERIEVPLIEKRKAQVLSVGDRVNIMDLESFESFDVDCAEDIKAELDDSSNVEYWDVEGVKVIKRKM